MSIIDELITDRVASDLVYGNPKGKYDYRDYNRVGEAANYVANKLGVEISLPTNYQNSYIPFDDEITTYRTSIRDVAWCVSLKNPLPTNNANILTIQGANQLEQALIDANKVADEHYNEFLRWNDLDELNETWSELDTKELKWQDFFIK